VQAAVGHQERTGAVEHEQALQHVAQRNVEPQTLLVQRARGAFTLFSARLCRLGSLQHFVAAQVAHREQNAGGQHQFEKHGHGAEESHFAAPARQDGVDRIADHDDQRIVGHTASGDQAVLAVEDAGHARDAGVQQAEHAIVVCGVAERRTDPGVGMRGPHQQQAVATVERERAVAFAVAVAVDHDADEELLEVIRENRADHDPDQLSIRSLEPAAEIDRPLAGGLALQRHADERLRRIRSQQFRDEIPIADIDVGRRPGPREVDQLAVGVVHGERGDVGQPGNPLRQVLMDRERLHFPLQCRGRIDAMLAHALDQAELQQVQALQTAIQSFRQDESQIGEIAPGVIDVVGPQLDHDPRNGGRQTEADQQTRHDQQGPGARMAYTCRQPCKAG
jgi:hypothetical protein